MNKRGPAPGDRFKVLVESSPDGVVLLDPSRSFIYVSPSAARILGSAEEQLLGTDAMRLMHPDDWLEAGRAFERLLGVPSGREQRRIRFRNGDGNWHWLEATAVNLLAVPSVQAIAIHFHEITALRNEVEDSRASEEVSRKILEAFAGGIAVIARDGTLLQANREALRFLGISSEDVTRITLSKFEGELFREDGTPLPLEEFPANRCLRTGHSSMAVTVGLRRGDQTVVWALCMAMPLFRAGESGPDSVVVSLLDITDRKRMEQALREGEQTLRLAVDVSSIGFWDLVLETGKLTWSDTLYELCGLDRAAFQPDVESSLRLIHPDDREALKRAAAEALEARSPIAAEFQVVLPDGSIRWLSCKARYIPGPTGAATRLIGVAADVTVQKDLEAKLRQNAADLHNLSRQLIHVQETERRRLSRELHDQVGQALTALQLNLQSLQEGRSGVGKIRLEESMSIIEGLLDQVRNLSLELRPLLLDDLGLVAALRWYTNQMTQRAGLRSMFVGGTLPTRPEPEIETACFRVAQEALTNVARHAGASQVSVELREEGETLRLWIRDDGAGMDVAGVRAGGREGKSLGLVGMEERVLLVGGRLAIRSEPGKGTEVEACFPLTRPEEPARIRPPNSPA